MEAIIGPLVEAFGPVGGVVILALGGVVVALWRRNNQLSDKLFDMSKETTSAMHDLARQIERWAQ